MICRSIVFVIAFSFFIVDIKTAITEEENEEQLEGLSLFREEELNADVVNENVPEEPQINAPIQTLEEMEHILGIGSIPEMENYTTSEEEIEQFFNNEHELLQKVEIFLFSEDSEDYSQLDDEVAYGLLHFANLTFWISTNFRICTLLYSPNSIYNDNLALADACNTRFNELVFVFNYLKEKIKSFFEMAAEYGQTYGNDIQVECVAKEVLTLSSDFVLDEDVLQTKQDPDEYVKGMIEWSSIQDVFINEKPYKTIFPSFKKLFCNCRNVDRLCFNYGSVSIDYDDENGHNYPWNLYDTDGNLIPQYSYQNFFGYKYPQFNVCNCGILENGCSYSSRNDDNGVYDDTNVASSSSNRRDDISFYNEKVQIKNKEIAENIRIMNRTINKTEGDSINFPTIIDMYNFLEYMIYSYTECKRFDLIYDYSTIKIGNGRKLNKGITTWFYSSFTDHAEPMWKSVRKLKRQLLHNNNSVKNVFRLIHHIRRLDQKVALLFAVD